jgi:ADP-ribose pyrophosphatase YjhB (NUDIX family)
LRVWWFVRRPRTYGVKCVIDHGGRWLMVRNTYGHRRWTFPGGGVRRREATDVAVRREILEEVGIALGAVEIVGTYPGITKPRDTVTVFRAVVDSSAVVIDRGEIAEAEWFESTALPHPRSPGVDTVVAILRQRAV